MDFSNSVPPLLTRWRKIKRPTRSREIPKHFECWIVSFLVYGYLWLEKNKCSIPSPSSFFSILYGGSFEIISFRKPLWHIWFWNKIMSKSKVPVLIVSYLHVCIHATVHLPWSLDTADHTILLATGYIHNHFWLLHPPITYFTAKPPAQMSSGSTGIRTPGRRVTCNPQPRVRHLNHSAIVSRLKVPFVSNVSFLDLFSK